MKNQPKESLNFSPNKIIPFICSLHKEFLKIQISEYKTYNNDEIDNIIEEFTSTIQKVQNKVFLSKSERANKFDNLPLELQIIMKTKNAFKKSLQREKIRGFPFRTERAILLTSLLNRISTIFKRNVTEHYRKSFENKIENLKPGPNLFKTANSLVGRKRFEPTQCLEINNMMNYDPLEITQEFKKIYQNLYSEPQQQDISTSPQITQFNVNNNSMHPSLDKDKFTNVVNIKKLVKQINNKKSAGPDQISNFIIKKIPHSGTKILTVIINNCINNSYFPNSWKVAKIIPLPKVQKPSITKDYRPLSLTNNLGKILEDIILQKLHHHIEDKELIPDFQFGFRQGHSTIDALTLFREKITSAINNRNSLAVCLFDIEKAFDTVSHKDIKQRLEESELDINNFSIINSFLSGRKAYVKIGTDNAPSEIFTVNRGIPQGTKLGPILYNISTIDQPQSATVPTIQYADDTLLYTFARNPKTAMTKLGPQAQKLVQYYKKRKIKINTAKTKLIIFTPSGTKRRTLTTVKNAKLAKLKIDGQTITPSETVKYLGINFHNRLKFLPHVKTVMSKARFAYNILSPIFNNKKINQTCKINLYKQIIRPIMLYGAIIWSTISYASNTKIEIMERKMLRKILNVKYEGLKYISNSRLYEIAKLPQLTEYNQYLIDKALLRIENHRNSSINGIPLRTPTFTEEYYPSISTMYNNNINTIRRDTHYFTI